MRYLFPLKSQDSILPPLEMYKQAHNWKWYKIILPGKWGNAETEQKSSPLEKRKAIMNYKADDKQAKESAALNIICIKDLKSVYNYWFWMTLDIFIHSFNFEASLYSWIHFHILRTIKTFLLISEIKLFLKRQRKELLLPCTFQHIHNLIKQQFCDYKINTPHKPVWRIFLEVLKDSHYSMAFNQILQEKKWWHFLKQEKLLFLAIRVNLQMKHYFRLRILLQLCQKSQFS